MAAIELRDVRFRYEDMAMRFDIEVDSGDSLAVIGPSGAGKSTLLSLIAGFDRPYAGQVLINGQEVTRWAPAARPVSLLFQDHNLFSHLTVAVNVGLGIHPGLKLTAADREQVGEALRQVGLAGLEQRLPAQLSGGQRQRVALARCLVRHRPVLLLDEPFAALGPAQRREMLGLVEELRCRQKMTLILVSHHPEDALYAARRTAFVQDGAILCVGETREILSGRDGPELRAYLGTP